MKEKVVNSCHYISVVVIIWMSGGDDAKSGTEIVVCEECGHQIRERKIVTVKQVGDGSKMCSTSLNNRPLCTREGRLMPPLVLDIILFEPAV